MAKLIVAIVSGLLSVPAFGHQPAPSDEHRADQLVRELGEFRASLPPSVRSDGSPDPTEERRRRVYAELGELGSQALPALARGLGDPDVQIRRNVALFLNVAGGSWFDPSQPRLNIEACLPALIAALQDSDNRVKGLAAQALGEIGPRAAGAVPALIRLLADSEEGARNSACIGLAGIGPSAKEALPALRKALSDPSGDVRRFAQRVIGRIEVQR